MILPRGVHPTEGGLVVKIPGTRDLPSSEGDSLWSYTVGREPEGFIQDGPGVQQVILDRYAIHTRPVTNAAYRQFTESDAFRDPDFWESTLPVGATTPWESPSKEDLSKENLSKEDLSKPPLPRLWIRNTEGSGPKGDHPVTGITWYEANAYAHWSGGRLPNEVEWEVAAGCHFEDPPTQQRYPWGDGEDGRTFDDLFGRRSQARLWDWLDLVETASNPTTHCEMMIGFHWEWCRDSFDETRRREPGEPSGPSGHDLVVVKGGSVEGYAGCVDCSSRFAFDAAVALEGLTFRCVYDWDVDERLG